MNAEQLTILDTVIAEDREAIFVFAEKFGYDVNSEIKRELARIIDDGEGYNQEIDLYEAEEAVEGYASMFLLIQMRKMEE